MARPRKGESTLSREVVIVAALGLLAEKGLRSVTLSQIALVLQVQSPSIYWHFKDKADLYGAIAETMFEEALSFIDPTLRGRELVIAFGQALLAGLRSRPDAAQLVSIARVGPYVYEQLMPPIVARVEEGGFTKARARAAIIEVMAFVLGWAMFEHNPQTRSEMEKLVVLDDGFSEGVRALARR